MFLLYFDVQYRYYENDSNHWFEQLDLAVNIYFLILYLLNLYVAQHILPYLGSVNSIVDLMIITPIILLNRINGLPVVVK